MTFLPFCDIMEAITSLVVVRHFIDREEHGMDFQDAYNRAMEEVSRGFQIRDAVINTFEDCGKMKGKLYLCAVTNGKELICRMEKGQRVGFLRVANLAQVLKEHKEEVRFLLLEGVKWYETAELSTPTK